MAKRLAFSVGAVFALSLAAIIPAAASATFAGVSLAPGATVRAHVPLSPQEKSYAAEGGNTATAQAVATLAVPRGFDPQKSWPVLVVLSTSDFKRTNGGDLVDFYRETALAEGWVLIAGDGLGQPQQDTSGWRAGMTLAALDALHRSFPGSTKWPVAIAGFSGGAKRSGTIAPLLAVAGCRVIGVFLGGGNEDRLSEGYRKFNPGAGFLNTPVFLSSGALDEIATPQQQMEVKLSLKKTGFTRVRQDISPYGHVVKRTHIAEALKWFRELAGSG